MSTATGSVGPRSLSHEAQSVICHLSSVMRFARLLAIGYWLLAIGYWLLAIGYSRGAGEGI